MPEADEHVVVELPATYTHVRLARLVASGVGNAVGFDVEEIEDLRIAVDEACGLLLEGGAEGRLDLRFDMAPGAVIVRVGAGAGPVPPRRGLPEEILDAVTDEWEWRTDDGGRQLVLRKQGRGEAEVR